MLMPRLSAQALCPRYWGVRVFAGPNLGLVGANSARTLNYGNLARAVVFCCGGSWLNVLE